MNSLGNYINENILVCLPALFEDKQPHVFRLVGVELFGLWLESEELAKKFLPPNQTSVNRTLAVLFPFSQVAYVLDRVESTPDSPSATPVAGSDSRPSAGTQTGVKL
jgi:hypothetical protein